MAAKATVDVSEFEKSRDQVLKDETEAEWKLAKSFEHTNMYRRGDNESVFKVNYNFNVHRKTYIAFYSASATWLVFPRKIVSFARDIYTVYRVRCFEWCKLSTSVSFNKIVFWALGICVSLLRWGH